PGRGSRTGPSRGQPSPAIPANRSQQPPAERGNVAGVLIADRRHRLQLYSPGCTIGESDVIRSRMPDGVGEGQGRPGTQNWNGGRSGDITTDDSPPPPTPTRSGCVVTESGGHPGPAPRLPLTMNGHTDEPTTGEPRPTRSRSTQFTTENNPRPGGVKGRK